MVFPGSWPSGKRTVVTGRSGSPTQCVNDAGKRVITVPAHTRPTDTKRSHRSALLGWVTFWVTRKVPPR
jgi:hypothetical protein